MKLWTAKMLAKIPVPKWCAYKITARAMNKASSPNAFVEELANCQMETIEQMSDEKLNNLLGWLRTAPDKEIVKSGNFSDPDLALKFWGKIIPIIENELFLREHKRRYRQNKEG